VVEFIHPDEVEEMENIFRAFPRVEHSMGLKGTRFRVIRIDGRDNWVEGNFVRQHQAKMSGHNNVQFYGDDGQEIQH